MANDFNIVVLISGSGSNLQTLIDQTANGTIPGKISAVFSNKSDVFGLERAAKAGIPSEVLSHKAFDSRESFDSALAEKIKAYKPDLVVLAGFMRILSAEFVAQFENKMINIHPSLLPKYTGLNTHQRAIDAGDDTAGATVHFVIPELDAGPIIIQGSVPILEGDDASKLQQRVLKVEHSIYPTAVKWLAEGRISVENSLVLLDGHESDQQMIELEC